MCSGRAQMVPRVSLVLLAVSCLLLFLPEQGRVVNHGVCSILSSLILVFIEMIMITYSKLLRCYACPLNRGNRNYMHLLYLCRMLHFDTLINFCTWFETAFADLNAKEHLEAGDRYLTTRQLQTALDHYHRACGNAYNENALQLSSCLRVSARCIKFDYC